MITIVTKGGPGKAPTYRELMMTSASDFGNLPTSQKNANGDVASIGSIAYTQDLGHMYMLGQDDIWREV